MNSMQCSGYIKRGRRARSPLPMLATLAIAVSMLPASIAVRISTHAREQFDRGKLSLTLHLISFDSHHGREAVPIQVECTSNDVGKTTNMIRMGNRLVAHHESYLESLNDKLRTHVWRTCVTSCKLLQVHQSSKIVNARTLSPNLKYNRTFTNSITLADKKNKTHTQVDTWRGTQQQKILHDMENTETHQLGWQGFSTSYRWSPLRSSTHGRSSTLRKHQRCPQMMHINQCLERRYCMGCDHNS